MTPLIGVQPDIVLYALRYGLGRPTGAHEEVCRAVVRNADELPSTGIRQAADHDLLDWIRRALEHGPTLGVGRNEHGRMIGMAEAALGALRPDNQEPHA